MPVTDARKELVGKRFRFAKAEDTSVKTRSKRAREEELQSNLIASADAQTIADERLALLSPRRHIYNLKVVNHQYEFNLGDTATLDHPRFGLSGGKDGIVIGLTKDARGITTNITLFV